MSLRPSPGSCTCSQLSFQRKPGIKVCCQLNPTRRRREGCGSLRRQSLHALPRKVRLPPHPLRTGADRGPRSALSETSDHIRAVAGFSCVKKKSGKLRKLLMQCSANYMFGDVRARASQGMLGGTALSLLHSPSDKSQLPFLTSRTPSRLCRPLSGCGHGQRCRQLELVWDWLRPEVRSRVSRWSWIYLMYRRLAMGGTHS